MKVIYLKCYKVLTKICLYEVFFIWHLDFEFSDELALQIEIERRFIKSEFRINFKITLKLAY